MVSCGAINSASLLLHSANDKHPRGLANSSDVVGRHYMGHVNSVLMAISKCPDLENLYVVDASFFVSSAAVNPALTIMANALRVGDHLLERMR